MFCRIRYVFVLSILCFIVTLAFAEQEPFSGVYVHPGEFLDGALNIAEREALIDKALDSIRDCGFTTIIPYATTTSGKAYWPCEAMEMVPQDGWDVLDVIAQKARQRGLRIMPAVCVLAAGHDKPSGILVSHPDWALLDKDGNPLGWLSPSNEDVRAFLLQVVEQLVDHIKPDGIMLDYMRYPSQRSIKLDSDSAIEFDSAAPAGENEAERGKRMQAYKEASLSKLMGTIAGFFRSNFPGLKIGLYSWGPHVPFNHAVAQPWPNWVRDGYLDVLNISGYCYTDNYGDQYLQVFEKRLQDSAELVQKSGGKVELTFALGVKTSHGSIKSAAEIETYLTVACKVGFNGVAAFAWGSMKDFAEYAIQSGCFRLSTSR